MSTYDGSAAFSQTHGTWSVFDGSGNTIAMPFVKSDLTPTIEGKPYTEAKVRNMHQSTPVLVETGDGNVTASATIGVTSFAGNTAATPYEVLTGTGLAAGWTTTAVGTKKALRHVVTWTNPAGATQTVTYAYCVASNVAIDPAGDEGLMSMSFDLTDHENAPTVSA